MRGRVGATRMGTRRDDLPASFAVRPAATEHRGITMKHLLLALGAAAALLPAAASAQEKYDGYLCCNMRSDGEWISDINYGGDGIRTLPAGTPVKVTGIGRKKVGAMIGGRKYSIGNDYSRDLAPEAFARRIVVVDDPLAKIASWPAKVQEAVRQSRVTAGMTREQVAVALGYPISSENPDLDAPLWRYWLDSFTEFQVEFDGSGQVTGVVALPTVLSRVWMP